MGVHWSGNKEKAQPDHSINHKCSDSDSVSVSRSIIPLVTVTPDYWTKKEVAILLQRCDHG